MIDVVMPQMGESVVEGTVTKWLKSVGDRIERDEPLFEISTEKVDTEVPAPAAGVLKEIVAGEGKTVAVNNVVARIEEDGQRTAAPSPGAGAAPPAPKSIAAPAPPRPKPREAPAAAAPSVAPQPPKPAPMYVRMEVPPVVAAAAPPKGRLEPMNVMRQRIAEHMVFSKHTAPHVTSVHRVDMTQLAAFRERHKEQFRASYGISLTFLPFIVAAAAKALRAFPLLNASVEDKNIFYHDEVNIGIAVALESGLIVPVLRNADEKNVIGLQKAIADLAARARAKRLNPDEVKGSTFSITNFGVFGTVLATPVINQPNVAILGVGAIEKVPAVIEDAIAIRSQCYLSLTYDHRLIDGAIADQFSQGVKATLERWSEEMVY